MRASVPDEYEHSGRDTLVEEITVRHMARDAGVDVASEAPHPELDADGDPDWRHLDAAQIRRMLGIPLAPVPPKPERYAPFRFRPREERPEPTERVVEKTRPKRTLSQQLHIALLASNAAWGYAWAKEELRKLKASGF